MICRKTNERCSRPMSVDFVKQSAYSRFANYSSCRDACVINFPHLPVIGSTGLSTVSGDLVDGGVRFDRPTITEGILPMIGLSFEI